MYIDMTATLHRKAGNYSAAMRKVFVVDHKALDLSLIKQSLHHISLFNLPLRDVPNVMECVVDTFS